MLRLNKLLAPKASMLTVEQVATSLAVCSRTVRRMLADGRIPFIRVGRSVRIDQADFDMFLRQQKCLIVSRNVTTEEAAGGLPKFQDPGATKPADEPDPV